MEKKQPLQLHYIAQVLDIFSPFAIDCEFFSISLYISLTLSLFL